MKVTYFMWVCKLFDCKKDLLQIWQVYGFLPLFAWVLKCSDSALWSSKVLEHIAHLCWTGIFEGWACGGGGGGGWIGGGTVVGICGGNVGSDAAAATAATAGATVLFKWFWYMVRWWLTCPFQKPSMVVCVLVGSLMYVQEEKILSRLPKKHDPSYWFYIRINDDTQRVIKINYLALLPLQMAPPRFNAQNPTDFLLFLTFFNTHS